MRLCRGVAAAHGLDVEVETRALYPVTVNDDHEAEFVASVVRETFGEQRYLPLPHPLPASEDFSRVLEAVPGALVFLGACPTGVNPASAAGNHSGAAVFDDSVLADGARLYAELARRRLAGEPDVAEPPGR